MNYFSIPGFNRQDTRTLQCQWERFCQLYPEACENSRKQNVTFYRHSFYKIMRDRGHSWTELGRLTGYDHSSVINGYNRISDLIDIYESERKKFNQIKSQL